MYSKSAKLTALIVVVVGLVSSAGATQRRDTERSSEPVVREVAESNTSSGVTNAPTSTTISGGAATIDAAAAPNDGVMLSPVLSNGATSGSTGAVTLNGTLGQVVVGLEKSAGLNLGQGFWLSAGAGYFTCCVGRVGDADFNGDDEPQIGDVAMIVDHLYITGIPLECYAEADVNQSGGLHPGPDDISIGDISYLVDYLFVTGASLGLPPCL